jgi:hypothetical protein
VGLELSMKGANPAASVSWVRYSSQAEGIYGMSIAISIRKRETRGTGLLFLRGVRLSNAELIFRAGGAGMLQNVCHGDWESSDPPVALGYNPA